MWRRSSCAKRTAFTVYSRMTERWSKSPEASANTLTPRKHQQQQNAPQRPRAQARDRIRGHEPETHEQHPEGGPRCDAHHLVARRREGGAGGCHRQRERDNADERSREAHPGARYPHGNHGCEQQSRRARKSRRPRGSTSNSARGCPGTMRLALTTTNGSHRSEPAPAALKSVPSRSIRAHKALRFG